jgi:hypothetical protein
MAMTQDPDEQASIVGDSAMDTGSESGAAGDHLADLALTPDELALLAQLRQPGTDVVQPIEQSAAEEAAVDDDSPLSGSGGAAEPIDDPLDVHFTNPVDGRSL